MATIQITNENSNNAATIGGSGTEAMTIRHKASQHTMFRARVRQRLVKNGEIAIASRRSAAPGYSDSPDAKYRAALFIRKPNYRGRIGRNGQNVKASDVSKERIYVKQSRP